MSGQNWRATSLVYSRRSKTKN